MPWTLGGPEKGLKHQRLIKRPETKGRGGCELEPHVLSGGATVRQEGGIVNFRCQLVPPQEDPCNGSSKQSTSASCL